MQLPAPVACEKAEQALARLPVKAQRLKCTDASGEARLDPAEPRRAQKDDEMAALAHQR